MARFYISKFTPCLFWFAALMQLADGMKLIRDLTDQTGTLMDRNPPPPFLVTRDVIIIFLSKLFLSHNFPQSKVFYV